MTSLTERWRRALVLDLATYNVAIFFLALLPPTHLIVPEWIALAGSALCFVGLISHASRRFRLPGEQWSYLLTAWVGIATLGGFVTTVANHAYAVSASLCLLGAALLAGAVTVVASRRTSRVVSVLAGSTLSLLAGLALGRGVAIFVDDVAPLVDLDAAYLVGVPLFLLSGVASAAAAHLIDGGEPRKPAGDG